MEATLCNLLAPGIVLTKTALRATSEDFRTKALASVPEITLEVKFEES